jgi:hypothetical protein
VCRFSSVGDDRGSYSHRRLRSDVFINPVRAEDLADISGNFIGQLIFRPDGTSLPGDTPGNLYYHLEDFENLLGILATDKPSYLLFVGTGPGNENGILTAPEPVGEGVSI